MSVRDVGRFDSVRDWQPQCIDQDVMLASFHALVAIEAANSAAFGRLYRLAIHDDHRWALRPTCLRSCLLVERCRPSVLTVSLATSVGPRRFGWNNNLRLRYRFICCALWQYSNYAFDV